MDVRDGLLRRLSTKELMLLNCGVGEDSWESLGLQDQILKEISPEYSLEGLMLQLKLQYFGYLIDAKNQLIRKDPDAWQDWKQEEKEMTEDEMVGWHHRLDGHEFEQAIGVCDRQGSLACCNPWSPRVRHNWATELNWAEGVGAVNNHGLKTTAIYWCIKKSTCYG